MLNIYHIFQTSVCSRLSLNHRRDFQKETSSFSLKETYLRGKEKQGPDGEYPSLMQAVKRWRCCSRLPFDRLSALLYSAVKLRLVLHSGSCQDYKCRKKLYVPFTVTVNAGLGWNGKGKKKQKNEALNDFSLMAAPAPTCTPAPRVHAALQPLNPRVPGHQKGFNEVS